MKKFVKRALDRIDRLDRDQLKKIFFDISTENELLELVLHSMTSGVIVIDNRHRIIFMNKASKRLLPLSQKNLSESIVWSVIADREIARFFRDTLIHQEKVTDREFTLENGFSRTISISFMPIVKEQRVQGAVILIDDVTEKRRKEARLRRAESLAALTTLTAGVAHEIKNPLGSIGIHIQLIQKQIHNKDSIDTNEIEKYLKVIDEEVTRLNKVVLDFLFAVRPMDLKLEVRSLTDIMNDLLEFLKFELEESHVTLSLQLNEIPDIELDDKYMKQALLNIIQNALQAMPGGGDLDIKTYVERERVFMEITDTGTGIPEEHIDKIFEPYFTTKESGSGLGLTIVYKIIKAHQGDILLDSTEGKGTTFKLSFPIPQKVKQLLDFNRG